MTHVGMRWYEGNETLSVVVRTSKSGLRCEDLETWNASIVDTPGMNTNTPKLEGRAWAAAATAPRRDIDHSRNEYVAEGLTSITWIV